MVKDIFGNIGSSGNADTVDGKHASDFIAKQRTQIENLSDIKTSGLYLIKNSAEMPKTHNYSILAIQEGWGITLYAQDLWSENAYICHRETSDEGATFYYTAWKKINDGGNADTIENRNVEELCRYYNLSGEETNINTVLITGTYRCTNFTNYPKECTDGQGILKVENYMIGNNKIAEGTMGTNSMWLKQYFTSPHSGKTYERHVNIKNISEWRLVGSGSTAEATDYNGSASLTNGLYIEWGKVSAKILSETDHTTTVVFKNTFSNIPVVQLTCGHPILSYANAENITKSGFDIYCGTIEDEPIYYLAIGKF